jgi:cell division protein FtsL
MLSDTTIYALNCTTALERRGYMDKREKLIYMVAIIAAALVIIAAVTVYYVIRR